MPSRWSAQRDAEIRQRYDGGESAKSIARSFGADRRTVRASLLRTGSLRTTAEAKALGRRLNGREAEVVAARETGRSLAAIGAEFGVSLGAVDDCLKRVGFALDAREVVLRRARLRSPGASFFRSIVDEEQAYWLGFIAADGCISQEPRSVRFSVQLASQDRAHLALLALRLGLPVRPTRRDGVAIASSNMALVADLRRAGIIERKSRDRGIVMALLRTPQTLRRHFVRGLFDGDGSAFTAASGRLVLELSGHVLMLKKVRELVAQELAVARNRIVLHGASGSFGTLRWRHPLDLAKLANWLYDDATVWLERKRTILDRPVTGRGASIYRCVHRHRSGRWGARIRVGGQGGQVISAGLHDDEVSAARAYDRLVRDLVGPTAPLNLPDSPFCDPLVLATRYRAA